MSTQVLILLTVFIVVFVSQDVLSVDFPSPMEKCHIGDEPCILEQAQKFVKTHPHGLPEMGLPDLEPLHFDKIDIVGNKKSAARMDLYLTDVNFYNYSNITFSKIRGFTRDTTKPMKFIIQATIPLLTMKAKYKINGKVLVLPITGEGDIEWIMIGNDAKSKIHLSAVTRDGKTFLKIDDYKLVTTSKNIKVHMTNLFNGDKALSENILELINGNWALLSQEIQPVIDENLAKKTVVFLENLLASIPYEDFFLPDTE